MACNSAPILLWTIVLHISFAQAETFRSPLPTDSIIGEVSVASASTYETLLEVARRHDVGYREIVSANPDINRWLPQPGIPVRIPSQHILPDGERKGIVLNLSELRLYYFPKDSDVMYSFPVSIGRMDWRTPLGVTKVVRKEKNPPWRPPEAIRMEHAEEGEELSKFIPGGDPENPLGLFALYLGIPGYLIHGTDEQRAFGIGMRVTHGCVRLYPEDIETLYSLVPAGTQVTIVDQQLKAGWKGMRLYIQSIRPLKEEEDSDFFNLTYSSAMAYLADRFGNEAVINPVLVRRAVQIADGIPAAVGGIFPLDDTRSKPSRFPEKLFTH